MAPPPNAFSDDLGTWIFDEFMESIVFVNLKPKDQDEVLELWDRLDPIPKRDKARQTERLKDSEEGLCSTGFIMKEDDEWIWILTCAHVLGPVFNAREPITAENADLLFDAHVLCDHREMRYKRRQDPQRVYVNAQLVQINCAMDLMLLIVSREAFVGYCDQTHLALSIAPVTPPPLQKVAMLSWPSNRHRTAVIGKACHPGRIMRSMSASNPFGYRMRISEVDITSEHGSSGAPLLNGAGEYAGVLHGGFGSGFSYFICLVDLRTVLTEWGRSLKAN